MKKRFLLLLAAALLLLTGCSRKGSEAWLRQMGKDSGYENAFSQLTTLSETTLDDHTFLRCQQYYEGIPVWKRHVICLTDEKGEVLTVTGNPSDVDESLSLKPTATPEQLRLTARPYLGSEEFTMPGEDDLCIYNLGSDGKSHLAYHISVPTYDLLIDAHTGQLLIAEPLVFMNESDGEFEIVKMDQSGQYVEYQEVPVYHDDSGYSLYDPEKKIEIHYSYPPYISEDPVDILQSQPEHSFSRYLFDCLHREYNLTAPCTWESETGLTESVQTHAWFDAFINTRLAYDYFGTRLSHTAPDGKGVYHTLVLVLDPLTSDLANMTDNSASGTNHKIKTTSLLFSTDSSGECTSYSLDTVAHEYAHGVEQNISGMNYWGESGAIMEGLSDIFGELASTWHTGLPIDWKHGQRILHDPTSNGYPDTYQGSHWGDTTDFSKYGDNGHVHQNSTVISHAAYLMSVDGGGLLSYQELETLWYRAMYMMNPDTSFTYCRTSVEWAAITMDLSPEKYQCISKAFDAVNIPTSSLRLAPGGHMNILDRADEPYSDYTYGIYRLDLDTMLDRDISKLDPVISGAQSGSDVLSPDLEVGYYYVVLLDNLDRSRSEAFDLTVWPGCPTEYDLHTNFGPFRVTGTVTDGDQPLSGVTVTAEGADTPSVSTDENGEFTLNHDPSIRDLRLVFQKEGYQEETLSITLTPLDLTKGYHAASPVVLKPKIHPYAQVIRDYETTYGTIGCHDWGYGNYTLTGVIYLNLLDFDSDGTQELVMGYCDGGSDYTNFRLTVWTLQDDTAVLLYDRPSTHGSDISRWFELVQVDGVWHVGTGYTGYEDNLRYYALQNGEFEQVMHLTRDIIDEYYYSSESRFNGIIITIPEYGAHYKTWHTSAEKIDCVLSASDPEAELNALRQQSRDIYRQLGMED